MDPLFSACRWKQWPRRLGEGWLGLHHGAYLVAMLGRPGWQRLQRGLHLVAGSKQADKWHMTLPFSPLCNYTGSVLPIYDAGKMG